MDQTVIAIRTRKTSFRWFVAGMIFVIYAIASADRANIGFAMPFIRKEFSMSNTEAGVVLSLFLWGYAIAQIPSGFATSRFGVRWLFTASMILTSLMTGMMGTAASAIALKIYRFVLGLAEGPLPIGIGATINSWFPVREKGTVSGLFLSAVKFGPVVVPPLCALIVSIWGWREIFLFFALPGILLAAIWFVLIPDRPAQSRFCSPAEQALIEETSATPTGSATSRPRDFRWLDRLIRARHLPRLHSNAEVFHSSNVWGCALGYSFQLGISNMLLAWIPTYLLTVKKFSVMGSGFVAAAPWVGAVIGNILGGLISDRVFAGRRKPGMLFSAAATAGMMVALLNAPADPIGYAIVLFLTGIFLSIGFSAYMAYPMALVDKPRYPVASALVNTGGQIGGACAPLAVGLLLDSYGWNYVFAFMAIGSLVSFAAVAIIEEPLNDS